jgi:polyisoprenoid-binding protein YceI
LNRFRAVPEESTFWADLESNVHPVRVSARGIYGFIEGEVDGEGNLWPAGSHRAHLAFWVEDLDSGNELRDIEMLRRMESRSYPSIEWVVKSVSKAGPERLRAAGQVTVHGRTRPFEADFRFSFADGRLVVEGNHVFDMRDFGIAPPRFFWLWIEPQVKVGVRIVARQVAPDKK